MTTAAPSDRQASRISHHDSSGIASSSKPAVADAEITTPRGTATPSRNRRESPAALPPTWRPCNGSPRENKAGGTRGSLSFGARRGRAVAPDEKTGDHES